MFRHLETYIYSNLNVLDICGPSSMVCFVSQVESWELVFNKKKFHTLFMYLIATFYFLNQFYFNKVYPA